MRIAARLNTIVYLIILSAVLSIMIFGILYARKPANIYATYNNKSILIQYKKDPSFAIDSLINWATLAASNIYNLEFSGLDEQLELYRKKYFTSEGFSGFYRSLKDAGTLDTIRSENLKVSAIAVRRANIKAEGPYLGEYNWTMDIPLLIYYETSGASKSREIILEVVVTTASLDESQFGYGIRRIRELNK